MKRLFFSLCIGTIALLGLGSLTHAAFGGPFPWQIGKTGNGTFGRPHGVHLDPAHYGYDKTKKTYNPITTRHYNRLVQYINAWAHRWYLIGYNTTYVDSNISAFYIASDHAQTDRLLVGTGGLNRAWSKTYGANATLNVENHTFAYDAITMDTIQQGRPDGSATETFVYNGHINQHNRLTTPDLTRSTTSPIITANNCPDDNTDNTCDTLRYEDFAPQTVMPRQRYDACSAPNDDVVGIAADGTAICRPRPTQF